MKKKFDPSELDARKWADEFLRVQKKYPGIAQDRDCLISWFSNAIMAGVTGVRQGTIYLPANKAKS